jgi:hypothetical protein
MHYNEASYGYKEEGFLSFLTVYFAEQSTASIFRVQPKIFNYTHTAMETSNPSLHMDMPSHATV